MNTSRLKYSLIILLSAWTLIIGLLFFLDYVETNISFDRITELVEQINNQGETALEQCAAGHRERSLIMLSLIWAFGTICLWLGFRAFSKQRDYHLQKKNKLEISEEKFRSYFENNLAIMLLVDPVKKEIKDANSAACSFYKYSKQEFKQISIYDINILPSEEIDKKMQLAFMKKANHLSFQHKLADGQIKDVEVYASPFVFKGGKMMSVLVHDVTKRNQTEQALILSRKKYEQTSKLLEALFDSIPDVIGVQDVEHGIVHYNKAGYDYLKKTEKQVEGKKCYQLIGRDSPCEICATTEVYKTLKAAKIERYNKERNTWLEIRAYPVLDESGKLFRVIEHLRDITERKRFVDELEKSKEKAEESDRLKSAFLANMSHEIRTPMNAILGFTQLLKTNSLNATKKNEYIQIIQNSGNHLMDIINDIIDISKIDAKQLDIVETNFDLNLFLLEIYQLFQSLIIQKKQSKLELVLSNEEEADIIIASDKTRLRQILLNLIGNSIKFTAEGRVEFGYKVKGQSLLFFVKDTGIGMSEKELAFVFDRFRQGDESSNRPFGGTGLGLAISKEFVELLEGKIWAESVKDKGSSFYFTIPLKQKEKEPKQIKPELVKPKIKFNNRTILIVEDDEYSALILEELLKPYGFNIMIATDGMQAIRACIDKPEIDLVLMDIQLPVLDGLQATQRIKKIKANLPIIAQTANAMQEDKEKALAAGCDNYISKPIDDNELIQMISEYIE
jgi:PAS domain S-box-containing protein